MRPLRVELSLTDWHSAVLPITPQALTPVDANGRGDTVLERERVAAEGDQRR